MTFPLMRVTAGLIEFEFEFESAKKLLGGFAVVSYRASRAQMRMDLEALLVCGENPKYGPSRQAWSRRCTRRCAPEPLAARGRQHLRNHPEGQEPSAGRRLHPSAPASRGGCARRQLICSPGCQDAWMSEPRPSVAGMEHVMIKTGPDGRPRAVLRGGREWLVGAEPVRWFERVNWWEAERRMPKGRSRVDVEVWQVQARLGRNLDPRLPPWN